jgi:hypothetical protein
MVPAVVLTGCGAAAQLSAADRVPTLTTGLGAIDASLAAHRYAAARTELVDLVRATTAARDAGTLGQAQAEQILASAAALMGSLPTAAVPATIRPTTTPTPPPKPQDKHHGKDHGDQGDQG